jgi:hypothetical protein
MKKMPGDNDEMSSSMLSVEEDKCFEITFLPNKSVISILLSNGCISNCRRYVSRKSVPASIYGRNGLPPYLRQFEMHPYEVSTGGADRNGLSRVAR